MDILELVFLVLMQSVEDADADLRAIMEEVKQRNHRLCRWRKLIADLESHRSSAATTEAELIRSANAVAAEQMAGLSELGETMQLRLQMAMDRRAKFVEALSNLLKKQSDTASAIVSNLK
jgi:hypothetical protein